MPQQPGAVGTVFISYASEDRAEAAEIADALGDAGLAPWIAEREVDPGQSFVEEIDAALGYASYLVLLLSASSLRSRWVRREWAAALAGEAIVLLPVLLEPCEPPPLLRDRVFVRLYEDRQGGIDRILRFLRAETRPIPGAGASLLDRVAGTDLAQVSRRTLRLVAFRCMTTADLQGFLFDAELEPGAVGGDNLHERLVALLHLTQRDGLLQDFAGWLAAEKQRCVLHQLARLGKEDLWVAPRYA